MLHACVRPPTSPSTNHHCIISRSMLQPCFEAKLRCAPLSVHTVHPPLQGCLPTSWPQPEAPMQEPPMRSMQKVHPKLMERLPHRLRRYRSIRNETRKNDPVFERSGNAFQLPDEAVTFPAFIKATSHNQQLYTRYLHHGKA